MNLRPLLLWLLVAAVALAGALAWTHWRPDRPLTRRASWQAMASPGALSKAHAFLEENCAA